MVEGVNGQRAVESYPSTRELSNGLPGGRGYRDMPLIMDSPHLPVLSFPRMSDVITSFLYLLQLLVVDTSISLPLYLILDFEAASTSNLGTSCLSLTTMATEPTFPLTAPTSVLLQLLLTHIPTPSRRLLITSLPANTHLYTLLKCVHSGPLLSATILSTTLITGSDAALIEFLHHSDATTFWDSLDNSTITISSPEGGSISLPVRRLASSSAPVPERISIPIKTGGASRVVVARNFPRRCIYPLLVEADLHRGFGLQSLVEISYIEDNPDTGIGMGQLTLELSSVSAAHRVKVMLLRRRGLLSRLPQVTSHFFGIDPCERPAHCASGPRKLPMNVADPVGFFSRHEFLAVPLVASLPGPGDPAVSTGLITKTPKNEDSSPATCPARYAEKELAIRSWTHVDANTGAVRTRVPFGWSMTPDSAFQDFVFRHLETKDPAVEKVVDAYFEARGLVNLRKLEGLRRNGHSCAATLWGILR